MHRRERAFINDDDEEMPEIKQRKMEVPPSEKERIKRKRKEENKKRRMKKEEEKLLAKLKKKEKQEKEVAEKPKGPKEPDHPPPSHRQSAASSRDKWGRWSQEEWDKWNAEKRGQHWNQKSWRYWTGYVQPKEEFQESEEEKEVEESSKRPRIAFGDRRLKNLDLKCGRMGPASSPSGSGDSPHQEEAGDEHQELLQVEEGELQAEAVEEEEPHGVGELTRFDGSAPKPFPASRNGPTGKEWTRVDLIVDSGASDSTLPLGVLPGVAMTPPRGYKEFAMAEGRILPNLGTKTVSVGFHNGKILEGNFAVVDSARPLLSIGKITKMGHTVSMTPEGGCIMLKDGKTKVPIYHRNGVWKVPVWVWYPDHFQGQGSTGAP